MDLIGQRKILIITKKTQFNAKETKYKQKLVDWKKMGEAH